MYVPAERITNILQPHSSTCEILLIFPLNMKTAKKNEHSSSALMKFLTFCEYFPLTRKSFTNVTCVSSSYIQSVRKIWKRMFDVNIKNESSAIQSNLLDTIWHFSQKPVLLYSRAHLHVLLHISGIHSSVFQSSEFISISHEFQ